MPRLVILPLALLLLAGPLLADEPERPTAPDLQRLAERVADRAAQHVKRYEEARQKIRLELIAALGARDVERVKELKARLEKVEGRKAVAEHVARSVEEATRLLASGREVGQLERAQRILAKAVEALGKRRIAATPPNPEVVAFTEDTARHLKAAVEKAHESRSAAEATVRRARESLERSQTAIERNRVRIAGLRKEHETLRAATEEAMARALAERRALERLHEARLRARHMREAAKHLREAGMREMAERVMHEAEELETHVSREARDLELHRVIRDLRREVQGLRKEVSELREALR